MATESAPLLRKPRSPLRPFLVTVVAGLGVMAAAAVFGKRPPGSGRAAYLEVQQAGAGLVDGLAEDLEADADAKVTVFYDASVDDLFVYGVTALLAFGVDAPFSFEAYETMDGLLERRPAAGDVVLSPLLTGLETERSLGCAFLFSEDPLLLNEDFMALLAYDRPLNVVETSDWGCLTAFPTTIHTLWKTSYSAKFHNVRHMPYGIEYADAVGFFGSVDALALPASERPLLVYFQGKVNYRKPSRAVMDAELGSAMDKLEAVARAHDKQVIYELLDVQDSYGDYAGPDGEPMSYMEMLGKSLFVLCPFGDMPFGGSVWEALTYGAIPVVEDRDDYKGCADPLGWLRDSGAPLLFVDDWAKLPDMLERELEDPERLAKRVADLQSWWAETRRTLGSDLMALSRAYAGGAAPPANECAATPLSDAEREAYQSRAAAYFAEPDWFSSFRDDPSYPMTWCSKVQNNVDETDACFDAACAPPAVRSFAC